MSASMLGGCIAPGSAPGDAAKYNDRPLAVSKLSAIDPGVENGEYDFAHATDPTAEDQKVNLRDFYAIHKDDLLQIGISDLYGANSGETVKVVRVDKRGDITTLP